MNPNGRKNKKKKQDNDYKTKEEKKPHNIHTL